MDVSILQQPPAGLRGDAGAGYYPYERETTPRYAFFWSDEQGRAVLLSKFYKTARGRDRVLDKVRAGQYEVRATADATAAPAIEIVNNNRRAIAASPPFPDATARDGVLKQIKTGGPVPAKRRKLDPDLASVVPEHPTRHVFRLVFYRSDADRDWQGMLSHPISEEKINFSGVDAEEIAAFVQRQLDKKAVVPRTEPATPPSGIQVNWPTARHLAVGHPLAISWTVDQAEADDAFTAGLTAKAMEGGHRFLIGTQRFTGAAPSENLHLEAATSDLPPGMYRLTATFDRTRADQSSPVFQDTRLIFLY